MCDGFTSATTGGLIDPSSPDYAGMAAAQEAKRQALINKGTANINTAFQGFTPDFYNQRANAYAAFANPQLNQQYQTTRNQIGYGLANRGLTGSGSQAQQYSNLNQQLGIARQGILDTGRSQAQALQTNVEQQRQQLLNQLYQSADPAQAGISATNVAAGFAVPNAYAPLANQFSNLLNQYYASQLINSYRPASFIQQAGIGLPSSAALGQTTLGGGDK